MTYVARLILFILAATAMPSVAQAEVRSGRYEKPGGWGTLVVKEGEKGARSFSIESLGANAHQCSLQGQIHGTNGTAEMESLEACQLTYTSKGASVDVQIKTDQACRFFCGARASFDGVYELLPKSCLPAVQQNQRDHFLGQYRAKRYDAALVSLESLYRQCGRYMNWIEVDEVRNDMAITQFHLGRPSQCLATLKATRGASVPNEQSLKFALPSTDFDNYIPVASATWTNLRLCRAKKQGTALVRLAH